LRQSQKMEAVGQLTGGIAHDFNNLLTVILGNLELLDRRLADDASRALSSEARDAAEMGARLTDRLLTIARQQRLETRRINLNDFVLNLSEFLRRTIGPAISLSTSLSTDLWPTMADPGQIESAVLNLAINARDAMPRGGKLAIQTLNVTLDVEAVANTLGLAPGDYVVLSVSDTGHGMSAEVKARAFEPFFTTKGMEKGSGLGLATIYGFARQSGGSVTIYSEVGQGTTVKLYLPRTADGLIEVSTAGATLAEHLGQGETVLVVEDDEHVRRLTVMRLADLGYRVLDVADGNSALEVLGSRADVDIVFSDLVMPGGLSGLDLARRVKELNPKTKVVLTSGYSPALMHDEAVQLLDLQMLRKPYRQTELARVFRQVLSAP
jgi:CheY-like chemotaxis protein/two-component sensor histidine kinase